MMTPAEFDSLPAAKRIALAITELGKEAKTVPTKRRGPGRPTHSARNEEIARRAKVGQNLTQQIRRILRDGPRPIVNQMLAGAITPKQALEMMRTNKSKRAERQLNRETETSFLERLDRIATERAKESDLLSRRPWNPESTTKLALAQGLSQIQREIHERLELLRAAEQTSNPANPPRSRREEAPTLSTLTDTGESICQ